MTWRTAVAFSALLAAGMWGGVGGCGGGGGATEYHQVIPDGYSEVAFTVGGNTSSAVSHSLLPSLDANATGTGTGTGVNGPTSIYDGVGVTCAFSFGASTAVEGYTVTDSSANCLNQNECIVCTPAGTYTSECSMSCVGVVPSSAAAAADTFPVSVIFQSTIATDMPDPYGTIRQDVTRTGTNFDLTTPSMTDAGECNHSNPGTDHELGVTSITPAIWTTAGATSYRAGYTVGNVDPDAGDSNRSHCTIYNSFSATAALTGANTPGTTVTNDLGTVTFKTKLCDYEDASVVAQDASECTEAPGAGEISFEGLLWGTGYASTVPATIVGGKLVLATAMGAGMNTASIAYKDFTPTGYITAIISIPTFSGLATDGSGNDSLCELAISAPGMQTPKVGMRLFKNGFGGGAIQVNAQKSGAFYDYDTLAADGSDDSAIVPGPLYFKIIQTGDTTFTASYSVNGGSSYTQIGDPITGVTGITSGSPAIISLFATNNAAGQQVSCSFDNYSLSNVTYP